MTSEASSTHDAATATGREGEGMRGRVAVTGPAMLAVAALASGCISIDLKPKELITETIAAGKGFYRTVKRRLNGTEERLYTHTVPLPGDVAESEVALACLSYLRGLADAAADDEAEVLEESTEILDTKGARSMRCSLRAVV